ncbi:hypothetical protein Tco_1271998 [Tanacetum coccineum]
MEDLSKLVHNVKTDFIDLESPKDEPIIVVESKREKEEEDKTKEIHATSHNETKDSSNYKLEQLKNKAEAKVAFLTAQPSFPNVAQLTKLLVKSLQPEFSKILSTHDFSNPLLIKLKELPSKLNDLTKEVKWLKKHVHEQAIKLPGDLKDIPTKLESFTLTVSSLTTQVVELKTLQWELLADFPSVPTQMESIQAKLKTLDALPKKGKKAMSLKYAKEEGSESKSDNTIHLTGSLVESSKKKKLKRFDFVTKSRDRVYLTKEKIKEQKRIEDSAKAKAAKHEVEVRRKELVDLLGPNVVSKYYKAKLQYNKYCDKMLNRRAQSRITNCDVLTKKGPITLKVYREDGIDEVISKFKASDLHLG